MHSQATNRAAWRTLQGYVLLTLNLENILTFVQAAQIVIHIRHEINLHIAECAEFGLSQQEMEAHEESQACTAYTRYVLDIGQSEDWLALQVALMPCLLGYGMIARRLSEQQTAQSLTKPNRYLRWINNYVAKDYVAAVNKGCELIEKHAVEQSPKRIEDLVKIFIHATKVIQPSSLSMESLNWADHLADGDRILGHGLFVSRSWLKFVSWQAELWLWRTLRRRRSHQQQLASPFTNAWHHMWHRALQKGSKNHSGPPIDS